MESLTGPRLTTIERQREIAERDPDEPPMPAWWDGDDASDNSMLAAQQLGAAP